MDEQQLKILLGKQVKFFRFHRQLSQSELAEKAGISTTFLSSIERGNNFPKAGTLCSLAKSLDIAVWELFCEQNSQIENKIVLERISNDVKSRLNQTLDTIFKEYRI